jgi:uncharacterized protein
MPELPETDRPATDWPEMDWHAVLAGPAAARDAALGAAARAGDAHAQMLHGQRLLDGGDAAGALHWFHQAARQGLPAAINMVGRCLDQGWGAPESPALAAPWFEAAARAGHDWGRYNLATLLALGRGVAQDRPRALALFRLAAAQGHAKSMTMIGSFHEDGWAVPRNLRLAAYHYARGAEAGDFRGAFNHARMLLDGGDGAAARPWLASALAHGTPRFAAQLRQWLAARPETDLRALAGIQLS